MFSKCVLFLFVLGCMAESYFGSADSDCTPPPFENGRIRFRQRSKLAKFVCHPRYWLVGNKYSTCRNGQWDVPWPVCVRPGCRQPERIANGLTMTSHNGAWIHFFCMPDFELVGSPVIYCNGRKWNTTVPSCVVSKATPQLSCDFEDPSICGWTQDELHDFDWTRRNTETPSSIHFTGPSFDHTLGFGSYGYFMYIESSSKLENDTARLISPIYDTSLTTNGCFSFSYHMYGKSTGGLRVYQKPDNVILRRMFDLPYEEKQKYILFEKWGNLGDTWFNSVTPLKNFSIDFQIVIEGIRGKSFTSDIAIDDVAILQGENCTEAAKYATTPQPPTTYIPESCVDRCDGPRHMGACSCTLLCINRGDCCPDFVDVCIFPAETMSTESNDAVTKSSKEEAPQTLKLVAMTTESTTTTLAPTTSTTTTTPKPTTRLTTPTTTTSIRTTTTTQKPTTKTTKITTTKATTAKPTTTTTKVTTHATTTVKPTTTVPTTTIGTITHSDKLKVAPISHNTDVDKAKKEQVIESRKTNHQPFKASQPRSVSTGAKVGIVILVMAMSVMIGMVVRAGFHSTRLRIAVARFRGHQNRDPEVRYLSSDVDDE